MAEDRAQTPPLEAAAAAARPIGSPLLELLLGRDGDGTHGTPGTRLALPDPLARLGARDRLRARLILTFDAGFVVFGLLVLLLIHFVFPIPEESTRLARRTVPLLISGLAASAIVLRLTGAVSFAAQVAIGSVFAVVAGSTACHGGIESPVLTLWAVVPIVAGLLAGRPAAFLWALAIVVSMAALAWAQQAGVFRPIPIEKATYVPSLLVNLAIACGATAAAVAIYEGVNASLRRHLSIERERYAYEAGHDALTGLPNRRRFRELQAMALRRAQRTKQKVGLFIVDLDAFKPVNDGYGHAAGDQLLGVVATRLREFTRATDSVARLGGDEFAVLVEMLDSFDAAGVLAERLHRGLTAEATLRDGRCVPVAASIGVALYPDHATDVDQLQEAADAAMYAAKESGRNRFCVAD